jgi:hypothetical protein
MCASAQSVLKIVSSVSASCASTRSAVDGLERDDWRVLGEPRVRQHEPVRQEVHHRPLSPEPLLVGKECRHVDELPELVAPDVPLLAGEHPAMLFDLALEREKQSVLGAPAIAGECDT